MKVTLKILLAAAVVLLVYMCYKSVTGPIEYDDQKTIRDNAIIARLIEIRKAQIEYKNMYKTHAGSFDDLEKFLNTDIPSLKVTGRFSPPVCKARSYAVL